MSDRPLFLRWALISVLTVVAAAAGAIAFLSNVGTVSTTTKVMAAVIVAVFALMSAYCGKLMWRADGVFGLTDWSEDGLYRKRSITKIAHDSEHVYFTVSLLQILGLLGTVMGFLMVMVGGFSHLSSSDPTAIRALLQHVATGSATALLCTLVGILTSVILGLQHHLLLDSIERDASGAK